MSVCSIMILVNLNQVVVTQAEAQLRIGLYLEVTGVVDVLVSVN